MSAIDGIDDEIGKFWVVTAPLSEESTIPDILFETNIAGLMNQAKGGLDPHDVLGIFKHGSEQKAAAMAKRVLKIK